LFQGKSPGILLCPGPKALFIVFIMILWRDVQAFPEEVPEKIS
jgi:hypothetical protein